MTNTVWIPWLLTSIGVIIAVISLIRTFVVSSHEEETEVHSTLASLEQRCTLLEMKIGMFWRLVEEHLSSMLKRPTHQEMDLLLDKLKAHTLTLTECYTLKRWLHEVYLASQVTNALNSLIATLVIGAVESLIAEFEKK